jgi:hypothetical protein
MAEMQTAFPRGGSRCNQNFRVETKVFETKVFQTKNPNLGKFWRALKWKRLLYSLAIWKILQPFCTFYGHLVIYIEAIWYIVSRKI